MEVEIREKLNLVPYKHYQFLWTDKNYDVLNEDQVLIYELDIINRYEIPTIIATALSALMADRNTNVLVTNPFNGKYYTRSNYDLVEIKHAKIK